MTHAIKKNKKSGYVLNAILTTLWGISSVILTLFFFSNIIQLGRILHAKHASNSILTESMPLSFLILLELRPSSNIYCPICYSPN